MNLIIICYGLQFDIETKQLGSSQAYRNPKEKQYHAYTNNK